MKLWRCLSSYSLSMKRCRFIVKKRFLCLKLPPTEGKQKSIKSKVDLPPPGRQQLNREHKLVTHQWWQGCRKGGRGGAHVCCYSYFIWFSVIHPHVLRPFSWSLAVHLGPVVKSQSGSLSVSCPFASQSRSCVLCHLFQRPPVSDCCSGPSVNSLMSSSTKNSSRSDHHKLCGNKQKHQPSAGRVICEASIDDSSLVTLVKGTFRADTNMSSHFSTWSSIHIQTWSSIRRHSGCSVKDRVRPRIQSRTFWSLDDPSWAFTKEGFFTTLSIYIHYI